MSEQLDLIKTKGPKIGESDVEILLATLDHRWWTAAQIGTALSWSDRKIRAVASASEGQIISGQYGYKLTRFATIEEVQRASKWLRHQANEMSHRALQIDRVYHRKIRPHDAAEN